MEKRVLAPLRCERTPSSYVHLHPELFVIHEASVIPHTPPRPVARHEYLRLLDIEHASESIAGGNGR